MIGVVFVIVFFVMFVTWLATIYAKKDQDWDDKYINNLHKEIENDRST